MGGSARWQLYRRTYIFSLVRGSVPANPVQPCVSAVATLIDAQGAGAGRCDAKCYDAQHEKCECVCGGMNHGMGASMARDNTAQLAGELLDQVKARGGFIPDELRQGELF